MTTVAGLAATNAKNISVENNKRGATIVRVCGEEHSSHAVSGVATTYIAHDNDMCFVSDYKFKLILGNGSGGSSPWVPTDLSPVPRGNNTWPTYASFLSAYPIGSAIDVDLSYGAQCYDYAWAFWRGQVNRDLANGGDNARGVWTRARVYNAGTEFDLITDWTQLKPGDWIVWGFGAYGHIAMAVSEPSGNSINVYNQNGKSGYTWPSGGKTLAQDTWTNESFLGAFRYKAWN